MYRVCKQTMKKKKLQPLSQSDKLNTKKKIVFIYFCIMVKSKEKLLQGNVAI